jgi:hypothetical protein
MPSSGALYQEAVEGILVAVGKFQRVCSRYHHAEHAPGWELTQPEPSVMRWRPPNGRVHTTRPTRYGE